jgi:alkaline phosphatase
MPKGVDGTITHSGANVPVYATGKGAEAFVGSLDNTDIFKRSVKVLGLEPIHKVLSQNL